MARHLSENGMQETCYVVSLKYSPIMWNHAKAVGEPIREAGNRVQYLLDEAYSWMMTSPREGVALLPLTRSNNPLLPLLSLLRRGGLRRVKELFDAAPPHTLVFINQGPFVDRLLIRLARAANPKVRIVSLIHEPYTKNKAVYGWKRALLLNIVELLSRGMARLSDAVILPSENAEQAFREFYRGYSGSTRIISLAFADERCTEELERIHIAFVGHTAHAYQKGVDLFTEMVEESVGRPGDYRFMLVTGNDPAPLVSSLSHEASKRLRVVHEEQLSDREISRAIRASVAVVLLQRRVMQSGVVPMAMMNGTPVIASDLPGLTQFVSHGETGWVVPLEPTLEQRFDAIDQIRARIDEMSPKCRAFYEETFDSRCVAPHVPWILGESTTR